MRIERSLYTQLGADKPSGLLETPTYEKIHNTLSDCIEERGWVALYGPIGSGKTQTVDDCLENLKKSYRGKVHFVNLYWPDRTGINIAEVLNQIIYTLGEQFIGTASPRRGKEIRMLQVLDILTEAKKRHEHIVLIIDEAHELHRMTLKALKRLWEYKYKAERDLLSIILVGQEPLKKSVGSDKEVKLRVHRHSVDYSVEERALIARHHTAGLLSMDGCAILAERFTTIGEIMNAIRPAMQKAIRLERRGLTIKDFILPKVTQEVGKESKNLKVDNSALETLHRRLGNNVGKAVGRVGS